LFLTAAYLYAWPSANVPYFGAVILHLIAGVVMLVALGYTLRGILRTASPGARIGWVLLAVGGILGAVLIFVGTRRDDWPMVYLHIALCLSGGALLASSWAGKRGLLAGSYIAWVFRSVIFLVAAALLSAGAWWLRTVPWERSHRIENPPIAPASMDAEGDGPTGPFFPSSAQTAHGGQIPAAYFTESQSCERCHADIYAQWKSSAHHFSSFNNTWYRKSIEYMQDVRGVKPSKWCAGCHDPALLFSGMFDTPIRQIENTPAAQAGLGCMMCHSIAQVKSTMGQGDFELEYPALHRLGASKNPLVRRLHDILTELNPEPHRRTFLKPFMRTQTAEFCSTCHKVHLDVPVNHYRWTRGFNEYDNWQASGVSGQGARSFYYPAQPMQCADCHMPMTRSEDMANINGAVHSHSFPAANTALPFVNEDATQLSETQKFLTDNQVTVDIFAISPEKPPQKAAAAVSPAAGGKSESNPAPPAIVETPGIQTTFAIGEESESSIPAASAESATPVSELTAPLNRTGASVRHGETYRVDVVVRTRKLGHFFPGGTVDAFDCWLELTAADDAGHTIFWSGRADDNGKGPVDRGAHFYRSLQIDAHGHEINKRNAWATRAVIYVHLIPPGAADTAHYRIQIPPDAGDIIHVRARLNYRKFAWWNTQFSFAGAADASQPAAQVTSDFDDRHFQFTGDPSKLPGGSKGIPALPIVVMAENSVDLNVISASAPPPPPEIKLHQVDWTRWNDYGIGLFLQGDLTGAAAAFEKITQMDPTNPDGWVNVGRVRVQEGNLAAAREALDRALSLSPHLARAHYFLARVLRSEGKYDEAIAHLRQVLAQYPRDRVAHDDLGRILFLQRHYADAVKEFNATLGIDPEDLEANYNLMLCYTGLGQPDRAGEFQKRYLRFKADESAQTLTGPYRQSHPEDNLERQPIHEHTSACAAGIPGCVTEKNTSVQAANAGPHGGAHRNGKASD